MADHYVNLIDKLVDIALCQGVEDQDLRTTLNQIYQRPGTAQRPDTARYKFPLFLFTDGKGLSLSKLKLGQCTLSIPTGFDGFKSVVELSFSQMHISDDMIQTLLENCPKLKSFHLSHCWGVSSLKIVSRYLELRDMMIHHCLPIKCIELVAPKLQKFRYAGRCIPIVFAPVPPIEHAWLDCHDHEYAGSFEYILGKSSIDFPLLTSLIIEIATFLVKNTLTPRGLPVAFRNLRFLTLHVVIHVNDDIAWSMVLLDGAPLLEIFKIEVLINERREQPGGVLWEPSDVEHHHLRQVEMYHFRMVQSEIALARLLLARSPSLQTITFCRGNLLRDPDWTVDYLKICYRSAARNIQRIWCRHGISVMMSYINVLVLSPVSITYRSRRANTTKHKSIPPFEALYIFVQR